MYAISFSENHSQGLSLKLGTENWWNNSCSSNAPAPGQRLGSGTLTCSTSDN